MEIYLNKEINYKSNEMKTMCFEKKRRKLINVTQIKKCSQKMTIKCNKNVAMVRQGYF